MRKRSWPMRWLNMHGTTTEDGTPARKQQPLKSSVKQPLNASGLLSLYHQKLRKLCADKTHLNKKAGLDLPDLTMDDLPTLPSDFGYDYVIHGKTKRYKCRYQLDKIIPAYGYKLGNLQWLSPEWNKRKSDFDFSDPDHWEFVCQQRARQLEVRHARGKHEPNDSTSDPFGFFKGSSKSIDDE